METNSLVQNKVQIGGGVFLNKLNPTIFRIL